MLAFNTSLPSRFQNSLLASSICTQEKCARQFSVSQPSALPAKVRMCAITESKPSPSDIETLKASLLDAAEGMNFGLSIDADSETMDDQEGEIEDLIEQLEDLNSCPSPVEDPRLNGTWEMIYTSSTLSRYFGGVTGVQRFFPDGAVESVYQTLDIEDGTSSLIETISFDMPFMDKRSSVKATVSGKVRPMNKDRLRWDAENIQISFWRWFAEGWKTVRAFKVTDTTYLDEDFRIIRGQTGSVCVFTKRTD